MAKYKSRYKALGFYVNGDLKRFNNGLYVTDDKDTMTVLDSITDAIQVNEPKTTVTKPDISEAKTTPKAPAKRTASTK